MNNAGNDNRNYSTADIARYHNGGMSAKEMYALEKAALEDPFLADTLEGFAGLEPAKLSEDMDLLKDRLAARIEGRKRRLTFPVYRVGIAAAVFLLAGSLSLIYFLNKSEESSRQIIVQQLPPVEQQKDTLVNQAQTPIQDQRASSQAVPVPVKKSPPAREKAAVKEEESFQRDLAKPKESTPLPIVAAPSAVASARSQDTTQLQKRMIMQSEVKIQEIKNKPEAASDEVVVMGYGTQKKTSTTTLSPVVTVSPYGIARDKAAFIPSGGWKEFASYFQKSIGQKIEWLNKHGETVIVFTIDDSGSAKDVRVEKSPDQALDQATISIIMAGPKWTVDAGAVRLVSILVKF